MRLKINPIKMNRFFIICILIEKKKDTLELVSFEFHQTWFSTLLEIQQKQTNKQKRFLQSSF